jgi:hypothetical protein
MTVDNLRVGLHHSMIHLVHVCGDINGMCDIVAVLVVVIFI